MTVTNVRSTTIRLAVASIPKPASVRTPPWVRRQRCRVKAELTATAVDASLKAIRNPCEEWRKWCCIRSMPSPPGSTESQGEVTVRLQPGGRVRQRRGCRSGHRRRLGRGLPRRRRDKLHGNVDPRRRREVKGPDVKTCLRTSSRREPAEICEAVGRAPGRGDCLRTSSRLPNRRALQGWTASAAQPTAR